MNWAGEWCASNSIGPCSGIKLARQWAMGPDGGILRQVGRTLRRSPSGGMICMTWRHSRTVLRGTVTRILGNLPGGTSTISWSAAASFRCSQPRRQNFFHAIIIPRCMSLFDGWKPFVNDLVISHTSRGCSIPSPNN